MRIGPININFKSQPKEKTLLKGDVAWSDISAIYSTRDFEKYNPDNLIGLKGAAIYKKMMRDEQVKAVVKFKRDSITSRGFFFEIDKDKSKLSDKEIEKRIAISELYIEKMQGSWMDAVNGIMSAMYNGMSITEKVYSQILYENVTYWGIGRLKLKPFDTFRFHVDEFGNIDKVVQKMGGQEQEIDIEKFIHFVTNPDVDEHHRGPE